MVLGLLIHVERALPRDRTTLLTVETTKERAAVEDDLRASIVKAGYNDSLFSIDVHETRKLR